MPDPKLDDMQRELLETLDTIESRRAEWVEYARGLAAGLVGLWQRRVRQTAARLSAQSQEIHRMVATASPVAVAGWDASVWKSNVPAPDLLSDVRIGRLTDPEAESLSPAASLDAPLMVPLLGARGPLVLTCEAASAATVRAAISSLLLRIAFGVPGAAFTLLSPVERERGFAVRRHLRDVRDATASPGRTLLDISAEVARIHRESLLEADSVLDLEPSARPERCFEFIVVADYPHGYRDDPELASAVASLAVSGPPAGRYLVIEQRTDHAEPRGLRVQSLDHATVVPAGQPSVWGLKLALDAPPGDDRMRSLFEHVQPQPRGRPTMIGLT